MGMGIWVRSSRWRVGGEKESVRLRECVVGVSACVVCARARVCQCLDV